MICPSQQNFLFILETNANFYELYAKTTIIYGYFSQFFIIRMDGHVVVDFG